jgi:hypothetical protein
LFADWLEVSAMAAWAGKFTEEHFSGLQWRVEDIKVVARQTSITVLLLTLALVAGAAGSGPARRNNTSPQSSVRQQSNLSDPVPRIGPAEQNAVPPRVGPPDPVIRTFGARWEVGKGRSTALILRNHDQQRPVIANVILFSTDGRQEQTAQVTIAPRSLSRLDLADFLKPDSDTLHWGGLVVSSDGDISGDLLLEDSQTANSFNLHTQGGYRFDTENALFAPWLLPDAATDGSLTLFNSSDQNISVTPSLAVTGAPERTVASFVLGAHASAKFGLREILGKSGNTLDGGTGLITLRYVGPAHALQPSLLLANKTTGFGLVVPFNAQHDQLAPGSTRWQFPNVSLTAAPPLGQQMGGSLTANVLLSNGTQNTLEPELTAYFGTGKKQGAQAVVLPVTPLKARETRLVSLSQFVDAGLIPADLSHLALMAGHASAPGDLAITVFSVDEISGQVFQSMGMVMPSGVVDASYWDTGRRTALPMVRNKAVGPVTVRTTLFFQTSNGVGSYLLPVMDLEPNTLRPLGLRQAIVSGIPDENGNKVPAGIVAGTVTLNVVTANGQSEPAADPHAPECARECLSTEADVTSPLHPGTRAASTSAVVSGRQLPIDSPPGISTVVSKVSGTPANPGVSFASSGCAPFIGSITPNNGLLGKNLGVTIIGADFDPSDFISVDGGVSATIFDVSPDGTTITAEFDIPSGATTGARTVMVSNFVGNSNPVTFTVIKPPPPVLESVDPNVGDAGNLNLQVRLDGTFLAGDQINVTGGVSAIPTNLSTDGHVMTTQFVIPLCASPGQQQVSITDWLGQSSGNVPFTVNAPAAPTITNIDPATWNGGATTRVTITGTGFTCSPTVTSSDGNITFGTTTLPNPNDPTVLTVDATVDANDPGGLVQVF